MLGGSKLFGRFLTALIVLGLCVSVANAEQIEVLNGGFILSGIVERAAFGGSSVQGGVPGYTQRKRIDDSMHLYVPSGRAAFGAASNDQDLAVVLSLKEALAECQYLMEQTGAAHCSPDYMVYASEIVPNDSSYDRIQGAMDLIEAPLAWEITRGSDEVVVAVLDTGVDYNHPDLRDNMWVNPGEVAGNGVDDDGNGVVDDVHGYNARANNGNPMDDNAHGTHCAGTIGARGNSGFGIAGVNWNVKIMALKFLDANGRGGLSGAIQALAYVRKMKTQFGVNVRVTNNSWGGGGTSAPLLSEIQAQNSAGILFVAAAGNSGSDNDSIPHYPSNYDVGNIIAVAAVDNNGNRASFSNYGVSSVDLGAPGVGVYSTIPGGGFASFSGTSMAAPHVAGVAGLILAADSSLSVAQLKARIEESGVSYPTMAGITLTGRILNANRAVRNQTTPVVPPSSSTNYEVSEIDASAIAVPSNPDAQLQSDELNFQTVALPFSMPFFGGSVSEITLSPNGVVYMGRKDSQMDFVAGANVPTNSVAMHADWTSDASSNTHVKAWHASAEGAYVVEYRVLPYTYRTDASHTVRFQFQFYSDGRIVTKLIDAPTVASLAFVRSATVGITGASAIDSFTVNSSTSQVLEVGSAYQFVRDGTESPVPETPQNVSMESMRGGRSALRSGKVRLSLGGETAELRLTISSRKGSAACSVGTHAPGSYTGVLRLSRGVQGIQVHYGDATSSYSARSKRNSRARSMMGALMSAKRANRICRKLARSMR